MKHFLTHLTSDVDYIEDIHRWGDLVVELRYVSKKREHAYFKTPQDAIVFMNEFRQAKAKSPVWLIDRTAIDIHKRTKENENDS